MGVPTGRGTSLGTAQGRIVIDTRGVRTAQSEVQRASREMTQTLQQLGGAFGLAFGAAGVAQVARFAVQSDAVATSFRRQSVAAETLAGDQARLNNLLRVYDQATGGALDRMSALTNLTQLMAVGFADSATELDQFARAIRGISVAMGRPQEFVTQNLILELFSQRGARLDQLGLQYDLVRKRAEELRAADQSLTQQMAYQRAVLEQAIQRFGALTRSAESQATGIERLRKAWADFQLEMGQNAGPAVNAFAESAISDLEALQEKINDLVNDIGNLREVLDNLNEASKQAAEGSPVGTFIRDALSGFFFDDPIGDFADSADRAIADMLARLAGRMTEFEREFVHSSVDRDIGRHRAVRSPAAAPSVLTLTEEQEALVVERWRAIRDIERQAARDRIEATRQYEEQRTSIIRQYEKQIAREAEDFALQRARAEEDFALGVSRMQRDTAQREAQQAEELARSIAEARADSAERIAEMEADFAKRRERAQADHGDRLRNAAARLDAEAIYKEQRDFARSQKEAEEDRNERLDKERKNLRESLEQAQQAHTERLEDARRADAQRLEDMQADFELRKRREEEDRGIRLERMAQDHNDQLTEMARQHGLRLQQISAHAAEERSLLEEEFQTAMTEAEYRNDAWIKENNRVTNAAILDFTRATGTVAQQAAALLNYVSQGGSHPSMADPYVNHALPTVPRSSGSIGQGGRSLTMAPGSVVVYGAIGQSEEDIGRIVVDKITQIWEQLTN